MSPLIRKSITKYLIVFFLFFHISPESFSVSSNEKTGLKLIKEGEKLFRQYKYSEAVEKYHAAEKYAKVEKNLSRLYLGLSRSYYALGLMERVKEAVNRLAMLSEKILIDKEGFPRGYLKIYEEVLAAVAEERAGDRMWKTENKAEKISGVVQIDGGGKQSGIIEKPGMKKKKKKFPILILVAGAVVIVAALFLLGKKKESTQTGTDNPALEVFNSIDWIQINSGSFRMGDNFNEGFFQEFPVHTVFLDTYSIAKYEITFDQYDKFCDATARTKPDDAGWGRDSRPVINVTWDDAKAFCDWLSAGSGRTIHLPTEAQWEKAARGSSDQRRYPWGSTVIDPGYCNYIESNLNSTQPVGSYPAGVSAYGLHDMAGNVHEFCNDWFDVNYYSVSPENNPEGPETGTARSTRGGSYKSTDFYVRSAFRGWSAIGYFDSHIGFRIAMDEH